MMTIGIYIVFILYAMEIDACCSHQMMTIGSYCLYCFVGIMEANVYCSQ